MATFSATANSTATIGYAQYGSTTWNKGTSNGACQGAYQNTSSSGSRVGVMVFTGAGAALSGKTITEIKLKITCSGAGSSSSSKVLTFRQANYQTLKTGIKGSAQVGALLGKLTGKFYNNTATHTLNAATNAAFFTELAAYLKAGNSALVLYNGETSSSSSTYSGNYAKVTTCVMTVTYTDGSAAFVWDASDGSFVKCDIYVWDATDGAWVKCDLYRWDAADGAWVKT